MNFKILDVACDVIPPEAEKVRIAWTELSMAGLYLYLNLQPSTWVYIPKARLNLRRLVALREACWCR